MADLAYVRLQSALLELTTGFRKQCDPIRPEVSAVLDAWSIVDSLHRLAGLLQQMPRLAGRQHSPNYRNFEERAEEIEALRHMVQHLNNEIQTLVDREWPVWGSLSWVTPLADGQTFVACSLVPGRVARTQDLPFPNPAGKLCEPPVGLITVWAGGRAVSLTDAMGAVRPLISGFEDQLNAQFQDLPVAGTDLLLAGISILSFPFTRKPMPRTLSCQPQTALASLRW